MRYFHLAGAYTLAPALILMCGLPGTGKSHAARAIARPFGAPVMRSDVVRKTLAGIALRATAGPEAYTPQFSQRTYAALLDHAREHMQRATTVVVDAMFATSARRQPFLAAARELGVDCILVEVTCPDELVRTRLVDREHDSGEVSDADWTVYERAKEGFEAPTEVPHRLCEDSRRPAEEVTAKVIDLLVSMQRTGKP